MKRAADITIRIIREETCDNAALLKQPATFVDEKYVFIDTLQQLALETVNEQRRLIDKFDR